MIILTAIMLHACSAQTQQMAVQDKESTPDTVFRQYMKAKSAGEPWAVYQVYLTKHFIEKSEKQLARYTIEEQRQMKSLAHAAARCSDDTLLAEKKPHQTTRKLIYAITNHCSKQDTFYRQVVFKQENGWKIDNITIAVENIYLR